MGFTGATAGANAAAAFIAELRSDAGMDALMSSTHSAGVTWGDKLQTDLASVFETDTFANAAAVSTAVQGVLTTANAGGNPSNPLVGLQLAQLQVRVADLTDKKTADAPAAQLLDQATAAQSITNLESAIGQLAIVQASIGATMMDLDGREEVQSTLLQNTREANARMNEVDFAESVSELTKLQTQMNVNLQMLQKAGEMPGMIQTLLR
jgi:flagellin